MPFDKSLKSLDKAKALRVTLDAALQVLETTENILNTTPIPGAAAVITVVLEVMKRQDRASSNAKRIAEQEERWKKLVSQLEECENNPENTPPEALSELRDASQEFAVQLEDYARELKEATAHHIRPRWMTCGSDEEALQDFLRKSTEAIEDYHRAQGKRIEECVIKIQGIVGAIDTKVDGMVQESKIKEWKRLIDLLPRAELAHYNADRSAGTLTSCSEGTREPLLEDVASWVADPDAHKIYWLKERAGFGKTAVALSVAEQAAKAGALAASFFFSYQIPELSHASHVVTTILYQLSLFGGIPYKQSLAAAIENHPNALHAKLKDKVQHLFLDPLKGIDLAPPNNPVVIIVDALDECQPEGAQHLINTFISAILSLNLPLKVFITSRPEPHLTAAFSDLGVKPRRIKDTSNEDVETFLRAELAKIPNKPGIRELNLPREWITELEIQALLERAGAKQVGSNPGNVEKGLFVYVATVIRFLGDTDACDPQNHLRVLLLIAPPPLYRPYESLDTLYTRVLDLALRGRDDLVQRFHAVVGRMVAMEKDDNLSIPSFETLLSLPQGEVRRTLINLQSVIRSPDTESALPSFHHRSFTDFLISKDRSGPRYHIDVKPHQKHLALGCLRAIATSPLKEKVTDAMNEDAYFVYNASEFSPEYRHAMIGLPMYFESNQGDKDLLEEIEKFIKEDFGWWVEVVTDVPILSGRFPRISDAMDPKDERELPVLFRIPQFSRDSRIIEIRTHIHALGRKELRRYISIITQGQDVGPHTTRAQALTMSIKNHIYNLSKRFDSGDPYKRKCVALLSFAKEAEADIDKYQLSVGNQEEVERSRKRTMFLRRQVKPLLVKYNFITEDEPFEEEGIFTPSVNSGERVDSDGSFDH